MLAYVLPATVIWALLGPVLQQLNAIIRLGAIMAVVYALGYGIVETVGLPAWRPTVVWQVPSQWIVGRPVPVQTMIWAMALGPGLVTLNPYAGIWLLPLVVALFHMPAAALGVGAGVGASHAVARALGVLSNQKHLQSRSNTINYLKWQWRWLFGDGLTLLFGAGMLTVNALAQFGVPI